MPLYRFLPLSDSNSQLCRCVRERASKADNAPESEGVIGRTMQ